MKERNIIRIRITIKVESGFWKGRIRKDLKSLDPDPVCKSRLEIHLILKFFAKVKISKKSIKYIDKKLRIKLLESF